MDISQLLQTAFTRLDIILAILCVLILLYVVHLHRTLSQFMRGENAASLETTIKTYLNHVDDLRKHDELISEHALKLDKRLSQAIRNVSTVRFKAYDQNGSNQSFAIALINEEGDGVILSSLDHPNRISVFAKPVSRYTSTHDLTEEEEKVLAEAKTAHRN